MADMNLEGRRHGRSLLLTLFHLGFRGIRLGSSMTSFLTPNVQNMLVEKFNIQPVRTPEKDIVLTELRRNDQ